MRQTTEEQLNKLLYTIKQKRVLKRALALFCALTVLLTMHTLKHEADTLERIATCGYPDHEHTEACYDGDVLVCDQGQCVCV